MDEPGVNNEEATEKRKELETFTPKSLLGPTQQTSSTDTVSNVISSTDTVENKDQTQDSNNVHIIEDGNVALYKGFKYNVDCVEETCVQWRCQESTRCQALLRIGKYPNETVEERFEHKCMIKQKKSQFNKFSRCVTVINKSYPEDWTIVPNDLSTVVVYTTSNGRKLVYYNKYKYVSKWHCGDLMLFRCFTLPTCKAGLKLNVPDETNKKRVFEQGEHICHIKRKKQVIEQTLVGKKNLISVKLLDYTQHNLDLEALLRLKLVPELDPNDSTTVVTYLNVNKNTILYYKGFDYILLTVQHVCYRSKTCKARLIMNKQNTGILLSGKHTCGNDITRTTSSNKNLGTIIAGDHCNQGQLADDIEGIESFYVYLNKNSSDEGQCKGDDNIATTEDSAAVDECNIATNTTGNKDTASILEPGVTALNDSAGNEDTASILELGVTAQNDGPFYQPIKVKKFTGKRRDLTRKLDSKDLHTVTVYLDGTKKLVHYKGFTYVDSGKKTLLLLCSKSIKCCAALKFNATKNGVCEVGQHNCDKNSRTDSGRSPERQNKPTEKPAVLRPLRKSTSEVVTNYPRNDESLKESTPVTEILYIPDDHVPNMSNNVQLPPNMKSNNLLSTMTSVPYISNNTLFSAMPSIPSIANNVPLPVMTSVPINTSNVQFPSVKSEPPVMWEDYSQERFQTLFQPHSSVDLSIPQFFQKDGKKYAYYQNRVYIDKERSYPLFMCATASCMAAIKPCNNKKGFTHLGQHTCPLIKPPINPNSVYVDPNIIDLETDDTPNTEESGTIEIKQEVNSENIKIENIGEQDHIPKFKTEPEYFGLDNAEIKTESEISYCQPNLTTSTTSLEPEKISGVSGINCGKPSDNNIYFQNYFYMGANTVGQACIDPKDRVGSVNYTLPGVAEKIQNKFQFDFAAANQLMQPCIEAEERPKSGDCIFATDFDPLAASSLVGQPSLQEERETEVGAAKKKDLQGSEGDPTTIKLNHYLEKPINFKSVKILEKDLGLDATDCTTATIFTSKEKEKFIYYRGYTYLDDKEVLCMCVYYTCPAGLKLCSLTPPVTVAEWGVHTCNPVTVVEWGVHTCSISNHQNNEAQVSKRNLKRKLVTDDNGTNKTEEELLLFRRAVKRFKSDYDDVFTDTTKEGPITIINHLLNEFLKVPLEEQTVYNMVIGEGVESYPYVNFKGYMHRRIRTDSANNSIISYMCINFTELCDGSLLMVNNKVVEYRDHFCKGRGRDGFPDLPNDETTLSIYYNAEYACPELFYMGFTYWSSYWTKWKIPDGSYWMCSKARCNVHLKIIGNCVAQANSHMCIPGSDGKKGNSLVKITKILNKSKYFKSATKTDSASVAKTIIADPSLIPVFDEQRNCCMIYHGYVYRRVKDKTNSTESMWNCIRKEPSGCNGELHIKNGNVILVSTHSCFQENTSNSPNPLLQNKYNLPESTESIADNLANERFNQNKSWLDVSKDKEKTLFLCSTPDSRKKNTQFLMYKGYIYRFIPSARGFQRWDCIYGGPKSVCRGVLSCKNFQPVAVSNHLCRENGAGWRLTNLNIPAANKPLTDFDSPQEKESEIVDVTREIDQFDSSCKATTEVENDNTMVDTAIQPIDPLDISAESNKANDQRKNIENTSGYYSVSNVDNQTQIKVVSTNLNFETFDYPSDGDIEATLPCTIIRPYINKGEGVIEISDDDD